MLKVTELKKNFGPWQKYLRSSIYNIIIYNLVNIWQNIEWYRSIAKFSPENAENKVAY